MPEYEIKLELIIENGKREEWEAYMDRLGNALGDAIEAFVNDNEPPIGQYVLDLKHKQQVLPKPPRSYQQRIPGSGAARIAAAEKEGKSDGTRS